MRKVFSEEEKVKNVRSKEGKESEEALESPKSSRRVKSGSREGLRKETPEGTASFVVRGGGRGGWGSTSTPQLGLRPGHRCDFPP